MTHTFQTTVHYMDAATEEDVATEVTITYRHIKGYPAAWDEPGERDSVEIDSVAPDVPDACYGDLVEAAFEDYANYLADAAEWKADMRRDDYA